MRQTRRSPIQDHGVLLEKFTDGRRRPKLRRGHRGGIDPRCRLPSLERLLQIDREAEAAVAAGRAVAGAGVATGEPRVGPSGARDLHGQTVPLRDVFTRGGKNPVAAASMEKKTWRTESKPTG